MCANVLIWADSGQALVVKNHCFLNGPSYAIALATYAHFNTRLTPRQCGGLCCVTQRSDSHGGNFCLTGDILSDVMQGAGGLDMAKGLGHGQLGRMVTCTRTKWKPSTCSTTERVRACECQREREKEKERKGRRRGELPETCWTRSLAGIISVCRLWCFI